MQGGGSSLAIAGSLRYAGGTGFAPGKGRGFVTDQSPKKGLPPFWWVWAFFIPLAIFGILAVLFRAIFLAPP